MKNVLVPALLATLLGGCVSVNEEMLRKVATLTPPAKAGIVEIKPGDLVQTHNGQGQNRGIFSGTTVLNNIANPMMKRWESNGLISGFGRPGEVSNADYTITVSGTKNEDSSIAGAVLSGLLLMVPPISATLTYDLTFDFVNNRTQKHCSVRAKNAVTTYQEILLLPAMPFFWLGAHNMTSDMADYVYDELRKQGAFDL